jgi:hypothetical protein
MKLKLFYIILLVLMILSFYQPLVDEIQTNPLVSTSTSTKTTIETTSDKTSLTKTEMFYNIISSTSSLIERTRVITTTTTSYWITPQAFTTKAREKSNIALNLLEGQILKIDAFGTMSKIEIFYQGKELVYEEIVFEPDLYNYFEPEIYRDISIQYEVKNSGRHTIRLTVELNQPNYDENRMWGKAEVTLLIESETVYTTTITTYNESIVTAEQILLYTITLEEASSESMTVETEQPMTYNLIQSPMLNYILVSILIVIGIIIVIILLYYLKKRP